MTDEQRPQQPPEEEQRQPPPPPPWPTLGANWKDEPPPRTETAPRPETGEDQWWQDPPRSEWAQPPVHAPWAQPQMSQAPRYPGARVPDSEARNWAIAAHLSPLAAMFIGLPFLGPLIIWLAKREDHPFIAEQAREALNFNLSMFIYMIASMFAMILLVGFLLVPIVAVVWVVLTVVAAVKAGNGEGYRYPLTIRMVN